MAFAQYGVEAESPWAREIARRMIILATYDGHETGVSEDNIDGGFVVNADWFKIAHPMALKHVLGTMAWLPEELGAAGENHILRSTAVVNEVDSFRSSLSYTTFDAPPGTIDTLRLACVPKVVADSQLNKLPQRNDLAGNGYTVRPLARGDYLVAVRHDGLRSVTILGADPNPGVWANAGEMPFVTPHPLFEFHGDWATSSVTRISQQAGAWRRST